MSEQGSLQAKKQRGERKAAAAAADALRNSNDGPPSRQPYGPNRPPQPGPNGTGRSQGGGGFGWLPRLLLLVIVLVLAYNLYVYLGPSSTSNTIDYKYSDFVKQLDNGNIASVTVTNHTHITGKLHHPDPNANTQSLDFKTEYPFLDDIDFSRSLKQQGVTVDAKSSSSNDFLIGLLLNLLPIVFIVG